MKGGEEMARRNNDPIQRFIAIPIVIVIGIFVVGAIVEELFGIPAAPARIFAGVGGIGFLVYYYRNGLKQIMRM